MRERLATVLVAVVTVALALGSFFAGFYVRGVVDTNKTTSPGEDVPSSAEPVGQLVVEDVGADDDPSLGPHDAPVTFVQFSDYECPFSKKYFDESEALLLSDYGDQVRYVYRDFPLASIHPHAQKAAEAAQCALDQDKYWEYHDMLFKNQATLEEANFKEYASALGLDAAVFADCLDSGKYAGEVEKDIDDGRRYGVNGTPTFFINGRKVVGAISYATYKEVIEEEIAKAEGR